MNAESLKTEKPTDQIEGLHNYVTSVKEIPFDVFEILKSKSAEAFEKSKKDSSIKN